MRLRRRIFSSCIQDRPVVGLRASARERVRFFCAGDGPRGVSAQKAGRRAEDGQEC